MIPMVSDWLSTSLKRENKIKVSRVREIFTPSKPINDAKFFAGRNNELSKLISQFNTPGLHSLLYGERGVGKSSLANVFHIVTLFKNNLDTNKILDSWKISCNSSTTFEEILREPLKKFEVDTLIQQVDSTDEKGANLKITGKLLGLIAGGSAEGGINAKSETSVVRDGPSKHITPSFAAKILGDHQAFLVIDEADRLENPTTKQQLAELIKQLSDIDSKFKILIVGVAETGGELIESHESISRCLGEIKLGRMTSEELEQIITKGAYKLGISFEEEVTNKIVKLSAGYPHFTHLLALKCAEDAVAEGYSPIEMKHLATAIHRAVSEYEGALKRNYDSAIISSNTDMYHVILVAAANLDKPEFSAEDLRNEICRITGKSVSQQSLSNYFKKLVSENNSTIFRRVAKGMYRFNDPRMSSYIKIANENSKISFQ